jgi:hypothetical protein
MDEKRKKELEQAESLKRRRRALVASAPALNRQEAIDLRQLTGMLSRRISNENLQKFLDLGLIRQGLGGLVVTNKGRLAIAKAKAKRFIS